ncbi:MAG: response regulator transcription factor [Nitrospirae bacterium]|jgi:DNA-binding NarL/FixJ family response regulator|nr:response regulator transcription factor [Nitrospirota bacterium]
MKQIRVVLADDHILVRQGIRSLLEKIVDVTVVGEVGDGLDALTTAKAENADVVLMDIKMPGLNGLEALVRMKQELPRVRVIILSMYADEGYFQTALDAGAAGYLMKDADRAELELALKTVAKGETYLTPSVAQYAVESYRNPSFRRDGPLASLTSRQREILQLMAEGHSNKDIATRLQLSIRTVESHRADVMERLGVHDLPGLVLIALRSGLINAPF